MPVVGGLDHWAKDCPLRFDVRYMNTDKLQMELEEKLATRDAVPAETEPVDTEEDFVPCDK